MGLLETDSNIYDTAGNFSERQRMYQINRMCSDTLRQLDEHLMRLEGNSLRLSDLNDEANIKDVKKNGK